MSNPAPETQATSARKPAVLIIGGLGRIHSILYCLFVKDISLRGESSLHSFGESGIDRFYLVHRFHRAVLDKIHSR